MAAEQFALDVEQYVFEVAGVSERLRVVSFEGREWLSRPFRFALTLASDGPDLDFVDVIGRPAKLTLLSLGGRRSRTVCGVVTRLEQGESGTRFTQYRAELSPRLGMLAYRHDCRIFQEQGVPDIVREVLEGAGFSSDQYRFELRRSYPRREYCVQYRESDLNFVARLLEDEGIFYYFEHGDDDHTLVMGDDASAYPAIPGDATLPFHSGTGLVPDGDHVLGLSYQECVAPGAVTLRDYNFKKPSMDMQVHQAASRHPELEIYDYPGKYDDPGLGGERRRVRLEALQADRVTVDGNTTCRRLVPGHRFEIARHPRARFNGRYLLTHVAQAASQPGVLEEEGAGAPSYHCQFTGMPADIPYRPLRHARRPVVDGVQTAIVVGPDGEEIYTDEHGRVKVQFPWDRAGRYDEKSSCWMRVSQAWAGAGFGSMVIPRIGQEVIVDFVEGDPDRPIVTGRVYHGTNRPPLDLPSEKVKSSFKSNSYPGGGGSNEMTLDDTKGQEKIYLHGQKDWQIAIDHDKSQTIGNDESLAVGNNRSKTIGVDQSSSIGNNDSVTVGNNRSEAVAGLKSTNVGGVYQLGVGAAMNTTVGLSQTEQVGLIKQVNAGKKIVLTCGSSEVELDSSGKVTIKAGSALDVEVSGPVKVKGDVIDLN